MIPRPPSLSCLTDFSLQSSDQSLQSYEEIDKGDFCSYWKQQQSLVLHEIQDPFDSLLQSSEKDNADVRKGSISSYEDYLDQEHTVTKVHYEERSKAREKDILFFQQEVNFHVFQDPMENLLQSTVKVFIAVFSDEGDHGRLCFWKPSYQYLLLTRRSDPKNQSRRHLLDWLHWKTHYT